MNKQLIPPLAAVIVILLRDVLKMTDVNESSVETTIFLIVDIVAAIGLFIHPKKNQVDKPPEPPVE